MDKTTTFSKQRFRQSFFSSGRTTAPSDNRETRALAVVLLIRANDGPNWHWEEFVIRRSFFSSGRTTAPIGFVRYSAGRSFGSFGANDRRSLCFFLACWRSWAVDRLVLGERPATALLNSTFVDFGRSIAPIWANDRRLFCLWILSLLQKALFSCFSASISVLLIN